MIKLSLITSVLDSHEVVRRQLLYLNSILTDECELVLVDDGSKPSLLDTYNSVEANYPSILHLTNNFDPWTHPKARNEGAALATGETLMFFDIDHIVSKGLVEESLMTKADRLLWRRTYGVLDEEGRLVTDLKVLEEYGQIKSLNLHTDVYTIKKSIFKLIGGYNEALCGTYGTVDRDFRKRYQHAVMRSKAKTPVFAESLCYVYPDPSTDRKGLFHKLPRDPYRVSQ